MRRRGLAVLLACVLAISNMGTAFAAEISAAGNTAEESIAAEEEPQEIEAAETFEEEEPQEIEAAETFEEEEPQEAEELNEGAAEEVEEEAAAGEEETEDADVFEEEAEVVGTTVEPDREKTEEAPMAEEEAAEDVSEAAGEEPELFEEAAEDDVSMEALEAEIYSIDIITEDDGPVDMSSEGDWTGNISIIGVEEGTYEIHASIIDSNCSGSNDGVDDLISVSRHFISISANHLFYDYRISWGKVRVDLVVEGETVASDELEFKIYENKEEYDKERDRHMLINWDGTVDDYYNVYVQNKEYPDGRDFSYKVTNVEIVSDEPWEGEDGDVIVDFHRDQNESDENDYWWYYKVGHRGTATLKVTYLDLSGETQSYEFVLYVGNDAYSVRMDSVNHVRNGFPGDTIELYADASHEYFDENGEYRNDAEGLSYEWYLEEGSDFASVTADQGDPSKARLVFDPMSGSDGYIDKYIRVAVRVLDAGGKETEAFDSVEFFMRTDYVEVWPLGLEGLDQIGNSVEEQFEVRHYEYGGTGYQILDDSYDVSYEWHYDQNVLRITESVDGNEVEIPDGGRSSGNTFTFTRKGNWYSDFSVRAVWNDGDGERDVWANYHFENKDYGFNYEIDGNDRIFSDGSRTFGFNLDAVQGVAFELIPEVGTGEWTEENGYENPIAEGEGWSFDHDNNRITFDGQALRAAGFDWIDTRISMKIGGYEVAVEGRGFEVADAVSDFWDLHDQVEFVDDDYFLNRYGRAYICNSWVPNGRNMDYTITDLTYTSDEDPFDSRDAFEVTEEENGWNFKAVRSGEEQIEVKVRVIDENGGEHTFEIPFMMVVGGHRAHLNLNAETGSDRLQSGKSVRVTPDIYAEEYDWETGRRNEIDRSRLEVRYEVTCDHIADRLVQDLYDGDFDRAAERGNLWDYETANDGSILLKSIDERAYEMDLRIQARLFDLESGEELAYTERTIFVDRVILEMALLGEDGNEFEWEKELPPGVEVQFTPQLMRNALDGDRTPVQDYTDVRYSLNGGGDGFEITDRNGNVMEPGSEISIDEAPFTFKRLNEWATGFNIEAVYTDDYDNEQYFNKEVFCSKLDLGEGFLWEKNRGDEGVTWFYINETADVRPDRENLDALKDKGYNVETTVELGGGIGEEEEILPIINYEIGEDGRRGAELGEYDISRVFNEQEGLQASGEDLADLEKILRYQNSEWGDRSGRAYLKIRSAIGDITLIDKTLCVIISRPYLEIEGLEYEMAIGTEQVWENGEALLYVEDSDHDNGGYDATNGDYFDIQITEISLEDAEARTCLKAVRDGADWKLKAIKNTEEPVPVIFRFTGGPGGYDSYEAYISVRDGVFACEMRDAAGESIDYIDMLIGEKKELLPYVTYTEDGNVTEVPAVQGGDYYYTLERYYDRNIIEIDDEIGEVTALRTGSTTTNMRVEIFDQSGQKLSEKWLVVPVSVSTARAELNVPEGTAFKVQPGKNYSAQEIIEKIGATLTVYSLRKPDGEEYPITDRCLEEVIGEKDKLILLDGADRAFKTLSVSSGAAEGEAILIIRAEQEHGLSASAGLKLLIVNSKEPQTITCDTSAPVVYGKTQTYTVEGAQGELTCELEDPSLGTVEVSGAKVTVTGNKAGVTALKVKAAETDEYEAAEATFDLTIVPGKTTRGDLFNLANNIKITWKAVPGAKYYKVYRNGVKDPVVVTTGLVGWDTCTSPALQPGTMYTYKIVASLTGKGDSSGDSPLSYSKKIYRLKTTAFKYVKNTAPGKVTASYKKSAFGDSYVLLYSDNKEMKNAKSKVIMGANTTVVNLGGFKKGKTYYFQIRVRKKVDGVSHYTTFGVIRAVKITQ